MLKRSFIDGLDDVKRALISHLLPPDIFDHAFSRGLVLGTAAGQRFAVSMGGAIPDEESKALGHFAFKLIQPIFEAYGMFDFIIGHEPFVQTFCDRYLRKGESE